jgi:hypothetical protein
MATARSSRPLNDAPTKLDRKRSFTMRMANRSAHNSARTLVAVRLLAAALVLFVGADHYYEYAVDQYRVLPTIGTLFLLNFVSATAVGIALLLPLERLFRRLGGALTWLAAVSGFGIAATSLIALLVSEQTRLFGFMELNYRPAILVALSSEAAAAVAAAALLVMTLIASRSHGQTPSLQVAGSSPAGAIGHRLTRTRHL